MSVKNLYDIATQTHLETQPNFDLGSFQKYVPTMINIVKKLCTVWKSYPQLTGTHEKYYRCNSRWLLMI